RGLDDRRRLVRGDVRRPSHAARGHESGEALEVATVCVDGAHRESALEREMIAERLELEAHSCSRLLRTHHAATITIRIAATASSPVLNCAKNARIARQFLPASAPM